MCFLSRAGWRNIHNINVLIIFRPNGVFASCIGSEEVCHCWPSDPLDSLRPGAHHGIRHQWAAGGVGISILSRVPLFGTFSKRHAMRHSLRPWSCSPSCLRSEAEAGVLSSVCVDTLGANCQVPGRQ